MIINEFAIFVMCLIPVGFLIIAVTLCFDKLTNNDIEDSK